MAEEGEVTQDEEIAGEEPAEEDEAGEEEKAEKGEKEVQEYNFRKPVSDKLPAAELRNLKPIFETFGRMVSTGMSANFRTGVTMTIDELTQVKYEDFIGSLSTPYILVILNMTPLTGEAFVELNPDMTFNILDRSLGGLGESKDLERGITDVEASVVAEVVNEIFGSWAEAWEDVIALESRTINVVQDVSEFVQTIPDYEAVLLARTTLAIEGEEEEVSGRINLCLPFRIIGPLVAKLKGKGGNQHKELKVNPETLEKMKRRMNLVKMPVICELGRVDLTVGEVTQLRVGDVVKLKARVTDNLLLTVAEQAKFKVTPGTVGTKLGVQIREVIEELTGDTILK